MNKINKFDQSYSDLLARVLHAPVELNARTGKRVRAVDGVLIKCDELPLLTLRDIKPLWTCAETVWFMSGGRDVKFMQQFGFRNWDGFADVDGQVQSATGYRWRVASGVDQLASVVQKLAQDPSTRQAVMSAWVPALDLVNPGPNAPCLLTWHLHCIGERLHMSVMQRSCDLYFGLPHDILGMRLIQELVAAAIGRRPGPLSYFISNAHLYEDQWEPALAMLGRAEHAMEIALYPDQLYVTKGMYQAAVEGDPEVVMQLHRPIQTFYRPFPALSGPRLVK